MLHACISSFCLSQHSFPSPPCQLCKLPVVTKFTHCQFAYTLIYKGPIESGDLVQWIVNAATCQQVQDHIKPGRKTFKIGVSDMGI